jgi:hypothetical protein
LESGSSAQDDGQVERRMSPIVGGVDICLAVEEKLASGCMIHREPAGIRHEKPR